METNLNLQNLLTRKLAEILCQGVNLLGEIDDCLYTKPESGAFVDGGAVGGHFRHCLEFVNCFLAGVENGKIDYDRRERNQQIETMRECALAEYTRTIEALENFAPEAVENSLLVKPEDAAGDADFWCASSIERELEFLQSHTIHHYALVAFKLRAFGFPVAAEFGVAPSTLRFWNKQNAETRTK
jgi:hypothetical protein